MATQLFPMNAWNIENFYFDRKDDQLLTLIPPLKLLSRMQDVRPVTKNVNKWKNDYDFDFKDINGRVVSSKTTINNNKKKLTGEWPTMTNF